MSAGVTKRIWKVPLWMKAPLKAGSGVRQSMVPPGRPGLWLVLVVMSAVLSTITSALGLIEWHRVFKPLVMVFAIALVNARAQAEPSGSGFYLNLSIALGLSMLGDIALMFPGYFIPGLVAFLLAHVAYIRLFKQGVPWFPSKRALAATLMVGVAMYAFLWSGGLPPEMRIPVAAYVVVIALMAAQAFGRASSMGDRASKWVALGSASFMLSDSLLATNRFVSPLPLSQLWVLSTYYVAQILIAAYVRPAFSSRD